MAITASNLSASPASYSIGPVKVQVMSFSAASGATGGTATFDSLARVDYAIVTGVVQSAAPTYSTNVVTIAFADPLATVYGQIIAFGR